MCKALAAGFTLSLAAPRSFRSLFSVHPTSRSQMVVLKARREHVEGEFLELVRCSVMGLEKLAALAGDGLASSGTASGQEGEAGPAGEADAAGGSDA